MTAPTSLARLNLDRGRDRLYANDSLRDQPTVPNRSRLNRFAQHANDQTRMNRIRVIVKNWQ